MEVDPNVEVLNKTISNDITKLTHRIGNLFIHLSGEGKVDFRGGLGDNSGWAGMVKKVISGDLGCFTPYDGSDVCALDQAFDYLMALDIAPHLNSSLYEEYLVDTSDWLAFLKEAYDKLKGLSSDEYKRRYMFTLKGGKDKDIPVVTLRLEPLVNVFVVGEYQSLVKHTFLGEIDDYDQPHIRKAFIMIDGKELEIELNRLICFRHRKYQPRKKDYLLHDEENDVYIILPQEDYSIH